MLREELVRAGGGEKLLELIHRVAPSNPIARRLRRDRGRAAGIQQSALRAVALQEILAGRKVQRSSHQLLQAILLLSCIQRQRLTSLAEMLICNGLVSAGPAATVDQPGG